MGVCTLLRTPCGCVHIAYRTRTPYGLGGGGGYTLFTELGDHVGGWGGRCTLFIELGDHVGGGGGLHTVYRGRRPCGGGRGGGAHCL